MMVIIQYHVLSSVLGCFRSSLGIHGVGFGQQQVTTSCDCDCLKRAGSQPTGWASLHVCLDWQPAVLDVVPAS